MAEPRTVLVVDDSQTVASQMTEFLNASGRYRVVAHAMDGVAAIRLFKELSPDIVCMDVVMPEMDGVHALRVIRMFRNDARVVMITSMGGVTDVIKDCLRAGALAVLSKPFDPPKVLDVLDGI